MATCGWPDPAAAPDFDHPRRLRPAHPPGLARAEAAPCQPSKSTKLVDFAVPET